MSYDMSWETANREVFDEYMAAGDIRGCQAAIEDAKLFGVSTTEMEQELIKLQNDHE